MPSMNVIRAVLYPSLGDSGDISIPLSDFILIPKGRKLIAVYSGHADAAQITIRASSDGGTSFVVTTDIAGTQYGCITNKWVLCIGLISDGALVRIQNANAAHATIIRYLYEEYV